MRRYNIPTLASKTGERGQILPEDVAFLRENLFNGEEIWPPEARALFDLLQKRLPACEEFDAFIVEAISSYIIDELEPRGALDEKNARFLAAMLRRDEEGWTETDLEILVTVMEKAGSAPVSLQQFAVEVSQKVRLGLRPAAEKLTMPESAARENVQAFTDGVKDNAESVQKQSAAA